MLAGLAPTMSAECECIEERLPWVPPGSTQGWFGTPPWGSGGLRKGRNLRVTMFDF
ncbi:hypothetical protein Cflav_PD3313 [Pedosphaera parvula Ellin514]|uniref:Uncharacterized protein n=1 Tax=Pedosphaera parvula (strain Ellin514) TaxID=320771 RepID=B9XI82_PEDPL|nr:hypothetical protein Cflav_PD3313 [Pedosphaera parvula Ellin514]